MHRRKIVLISGSGRTGSTLLSLLLTQHREVFNLGQLRDLPGAWAKDAPCTCGHTLTTCPVYSKVGPKVDLGLLGELQAAFFADARRHDDWGARGTIKALGDEHRPYLAGLARLLDAIQEATGVETFVDASKSPEMARALSLIEGVDARVLNLVRDPRAVAVSWRQRRGRISAAWKFAKDWAWRQRTLETWAASLGERFRQVRYEAFAAHPRETVAETLEWAGLPPSNALFTADDQAAISWKGQHLYPPANERVLAEKATAMTIRPSEGWRDKRHALARALAMLASGEAGRAYVAG